MFILLPYVKTNKHHKDSKILLTKKIYVFIIKVKLNLNAEDFVTLLKL